VYWRNSRSKPHGGRRARRARVERFSASRRPPPLQLRQSHPARVPGFPARGSIGREARAACRIDRARALRVSGRERRDFDRATGGMFAERAGPSRCWTQPRRHRTRHRTSGTGRSAVRLPDRRSGGRRAGCHRVTQTTPAYAR
jgi:hypothetical protein